MPTIEQVAAEALVDFGYPIARRRRRAGAPPEAVQAAASCGRRRPARQRDIERPRHGGSTPDQVQYVVDRLLAGLEAGDAGQVEAVLSPTVEIHLHDTGDHAARTGRSGAAARSLWSPPPARTAPQVRGDSHPGSPSFTVVWTHQEPTGQVQRVLVITVDSAERVSRLDYYQSP